MFEMRCLSGACGPLGNIGDAGNVVPTASGGGRARLAQRARNLAWNELDFLGKNELKSNALSQTRPTVEWISIRLKSFLETSVNH